MTKAASIVTAVFAAFFITSTVNASVWRDLYAFPSLEDMTAAITAVCDAVFSPYETSYAITNQIPNEVDFTCTLIANGATSNKNLKLYCVDPETGSNTFAPADGVCPEDVPPDCAQGLTEYVNGSGDIAPSSVCVGQCSFNLVKGHSYNQTGEFAYYGEYESTGGSCTDPAPTAPFDPLSPVNPCADSALGETCIAGPGGPEPDNGGTPETGDGVPDGENCIGIGGQNFCLEPNQDCVTINGSPWCMNDPTPNCGTFNGQLVCTDHDPFTPNETAPVGCISDGAKTVCLDTPVAQEETTTTSTTTNPDGSITTTTTTTDGSGNTTIISTTETTNPDGSVTTSVSTSGSGSEEEVYPTIPAPDNDQFSSMLDGIYDELTSGMGQDDPGDPGYSNPFNMPAASGCTQMTIGIGQFQTTFPGTDGCSRLATLRSYLEWALYILTAISIIAISLNRPV